MISKLWRLIQPSTRLRFAVLVGVVCVGGPVELGGIAVVAAMMQLVASGGKPSPDSLLGSALNALGAFTPSHALWGGFCISAMVLGFVHGFIALRSYLRSEFSWRQDEELSCRLFASVLAKPYVWFLPRNTAEVLHLVLSGEIVQRVLGAGLSVMGQLSVSTTLLLALIWTDPKVTFVGILAVGTAYGLVRLLTRELLEVRGSGAHYADRQRRRVAQEVLGSIRYVKTSGKEPFFLQRFQKYSRTATSGMVYHAIYVDVVRAFLEWVTFTGILILSVTLALSSSDLQLLLPKLTLYTMATYRIVPAVHELFGLWARMRFDDAHLDDIAKILAKQAKVENSNIKALPKLDEASLILKLQGVHFAYSPDAKNILDGIDIEINPGEWIGVVGTSGAGKTTLLDILSGLLMPSQGDLLVDCQPVNGSLSDSWHRQIGVVPQDIFLLDDTLRQNVAFGIPAEDIDELRVIEACRAAGLAQLISRLPEGYATPLGERGVRLSGGERQRVGIARALYTKPKLLLLDEATSALDLATEAQIVETLRELRVNCTLVTVAHRLSSVKPCDRILVLESGRIVAEGPYQDLVSESSAFQELARLSYD